MRFRLCIMAFALGAFVSQIGFAQAPAGAPAGSTGQCKDGTYTNVASKSGACRGHKGVKAWYAASPAKSSNTATTPSSPAAAPVKSAPATPAAAPASTGSTSQSTHSTKTVAQAPGGGPGLVWLNTSSNVYHCPGTRYYGKTKAGKYVTEAQAKAAGAHPVQGKGCGQ
jgi:hypothetical protein